MKSENSIVSYVANADYIRIIRKRITCTDADRDVLEPYVENGKVCIVIRKNKGYKFCEKCKRTSAINYLDFDAEKDMVLFNLYLLSIKGSRQNVEERTYLAGRSDGSVFLKQVPEECRTVKEALKSLNQEQHSIINLLKTFFQRNK